ncbi:pyruvate, water dikinase regulatory protein [Tepidamorphus sp. 3E244]|uniref:pyruvate, water dikinase regulatory protein n=1 Tax=Tepidamorphus sp. 3E244 TaxID=3385498 RepID=UPI0038FD03EE
MPNTGRSYFHLHLVSDSTGETLMTVARAAAAQYPRVRAIEHVYPLVRSHTQLDRVLREIEASPGIVLYTIINQDISKRIETACRDFGSPCLSVLDPILVIFQSYLGAEKSPRVAGQHVLDQDYFRRIDALNFALVHDDGQQTGNYEEADVVLLGISRTSKTPTCIYLANRGIKAANIPLVPGIPLPPGLESLKNPLVVGLVASPERIVQIRQHRLLTLNADDESAYIDRMAVAEEVTYTRKLCARNGWPMIDVTRRSIEETAAAVVNLLNERRAEPVKTTSS